MIQHAVVQGLVSSQKNEFGGKIFPFGLYDFLTPLLVMNRPENEIFDRSCNEDSMVPTVFQRANSNKYKQLGGRGMFSFVLHQVPKDIAQRTFT